MEYVFYKEDKKYQRISAFKHSLGSMIFWFVVFAVIYNFGRLIFPKEFTLLAKAPLVKVTVLSLILYSGLSKYFYLTHDTWAAINKARTNKETELMSLKQLLYFSEIQVSLSEKLWDAVKSFSPIPLAVFVLGIFTGNNPILNKTIIIAQNSITVKNLFIYGGYGFIALYAFLLKATYDRLKWKKLQNSLFYDAILYYEYKNNKKP